MSAASSSDLDIAIVGMAARFPGSDSVAQFWGNLIDGVESITRFELHELIGRGIPAEEALHPDYVPARGVLSRIDGFDTELIRFSPAEAALLDPQQRVFLQVCWEAFEDAGLDPERSGGTVGVFAGQTLSTYLINVLLPNAPLMRRSRPWDLGLANEKDMLATRVAYKLGLTGPAVTVQTACSTSLVAVHYAAQSLLACECDFALAGGVSITVPQESGYLFDAGSILSADGHCRPFDAKAGGTVFGNGAGAVVLMRLSDALERGFSIRAVIKGSAVNNDGHGKAGYTAPSAAGHAQVVKRALAIAGVEPASIGFIEAHGTGTAVGDPIELAALAAAFEGVPPGSCVLGSVKGNVGHLDNAAGIASLIKAALAVQRGVVPGTLHFHEPNSRIQWSELPFVASGSTRPWRAASSPRRAGVSSLGIGGTNAHVVLEQAPQLQTGAGATSPAARLLTISAASQAALEANRERLASALAADSALTLQDAAFTTQMGRRQLGMRWSCAAVSKADAIHQLRARSTAPQPAYASPRLVFMFPGQGAQHAGMTAALYQESEIYRSAFDACADEASRRSSTDLRLSLRAGELCAPVVVQLSLFAVEYALAQMWMHWGLQPDACIGHSLGEYAAATVAGVMSLRQAIEIITIRASLMRATEAGAMLVAQLDGAQAQRFLQAGVAIAALNSPDQTVFSGRVQDVANLKARLDQAGIAVTPLETALAFHSETMDPIVKGFVQAVATQQLSAPRVPLISNVTGRRILRDEATSAQYWGDHLRMPVRFSEGIREAAAVRPTVFLEVGPGRTLTGLVSRRRDFTTPFVCVPSLPRQGGSSVDVLRALGTLWNAGIAVEWEQFWRGTAARRVSLPTYAFQQKRYWIETEPVATPAPARLAGAAAFIPVWSRVAKHSRSANSEVRGQTWLLLGDDIDFASALARSLDGIGVNAVVAAKPVRAGHPPPARVIYFASAHGAHSIAQLLKIFHDRAFKLDVVVRGAVCIADECSVDESLAALSGVLSVVEAEYPDVRCKLIDVHSGGSKSPRALIQLRDELVCDDPEPFVALRGMERWVRRLQELSSRESEAAHPLRSGAVCVITGGCGDLALALAGALFQRYQARIVLLGHRRAAAVTKVQALREAGADVTTIEADVTDLNALKSALESVIACHGCVNAIFHAAGVAGGTLIAEGFGKRSQAVLDAKVTGVQRLEAAIAGLNVDCVALFSSIAALQARQGQFYYAFANAYLDAFAQARSCSSPHRIVSIGWDSWQDIGMAARARVDAMNQSAAVVPHAILGKRLRGMYAEHLYVGSLSASAHWVLSEHWIGGHPVLPATAHLEFVRAAAQHMTGSESLCLRDVRFMTPLLLEDAAETLLVVALEAEGDSLRFTVLGQPHAAKGQLRACVAGLVSVQPHAATRSYVSQVTEGWSPVDVQAALAETLEHVALGPRWSCISSICAGRAMWEMQLELNAAFHADLADFPMHPALLDAAWSAARLASRANVLPTAIGSLTVSGALSPRLRVQAKLLEDDGTALRLDVEVFDSNDALVLRAERLAFRRVTASALARLDSDFGADLSPQLKATLDTFGIGAAPALRSTDALDALFRILECSHAPHVVVTADHDFVQSFNNPSPRQAAALPPLAAAHAGQSAEAITAIFADVLNAPDMHPDDNFFAAGGDSLNAIRVVAQAKARGIAISVATILAHPTARELAEQLALSRIPVSTEPQSQPFEALDTEDRSHLPEGLDDAYPLGSLQAGAVFHRYHAPGDAIYHDVLVVRFRGPENIAHLQAAFDEAVRCHPILRTSIDLENYREPLQLVWSTGRVPLQTVDLGAEQAALRRWIAVELSCPINLQRAPLIRAFLLRLPAEEQALALSIDDAILDGWSVASLATRVLEDYDRRLQGLEGVSQGAPVPYREFVLMERRAAADAGHKAFWQRKVTSCSPTRVPRRFDASDRHRIRTHRVPLPADAATGVVALAQAWGVPLKHLLLAVHLRVLALMTGGDQVVTGLETNGRLERTGGELTLGQHLNTLPFVMTLRPGHWRALVADVAATESELLPYRRFPLSSIVKHRDDGAPFDVVFNFTHFHVYGRTSEMGTLQVLDISGYGQTHYPLRTEFNVDHETGSARLFLEFNECALSPQLIEGLSRAYAATLSRLVAEPSGVWHEWACAPINRARFAPPNVLSLFEDCVEQAPHRIALRDPGEQWSYRALDNIASAYAQALLDHGVRAGDCIALYVQRSAEAVAAILGILKTGAAYLPLDISHPSERLQHIVGICRPKAAIAGMDSHELPQPLKRLPVIRKPASGGPVLKARAHLQSEQPAYVICTSGTSGTPKAVVVQHGALAGSTHARIAHYKSACEAFMLTSPLTFDSSIAGLFGTLCSGGTLLLAPAGAERNPDQLVRLHQTYQPTRWLCVPALYQAVLDLTSATQLAHLREVIVAGEQCPKSLVEMHYGRQTRAVLYNEYGPTEATVWASVHRCELQDARAADPVPIGASRENVEVYIMDTRLQRVPDGLRGEICIGGSGVALGYLDNPAETALRFRPNPLADQPGMRLYRSGDVGWRDERGILTYIGRHDGQVKIRGHRVECGEIEAVLQAQAGVRAAAVIATTSPRRALQLIAHVVLEKNGSHDEQSLRQVLGSVLPDYMVPARIVFRDALVLTSHGKVDKARLIEALTDEPLDRRQQLLSQVRAMSPQELDAALSHFKEEAAHDGALRRAGRAGPQATRTDRAAPGA